MEKVAVERVEPERVMGVDPGLTWTGFGVIEARRGSTAAVAEGRIATEKERPAPQRLAELFEGLTVAIEQWRPGAIAVERVFVNLNTRTAVGAIQASGVALLAAGRSGIPVHEYTPLEVKQAVVGTGAASKEQVRFMVARILGLGSGPKTADAADALAVAICHVNSRKMRSLQEGVR